MPEPARPLTVGFVLMPRFTMLAFAGFLDTLRLAADERDRSRQIACRWTIMSQDGNAVAASNGTLVAVDGGLSDPSEFDYITVVGGTLHDGLPAGPPLLAWLAAAAAARVPLAGVCTGSFVLARAGLLRGYRACVSWFHRQDFEAEFPGHETTSSQLFVMDRDRITCAGGTGVIHLASHLVEQHLGPGRSAKGLGVMLEAGARPALSPQPLPGLPLLPPETDPRVRRAVALLEQRLTDDFPVAELADAVGLSQRQLVRLFRAHTGEPPTAYRQTLRLARARALIRQTALPLTEIAFRCGFADAAHFSRTYQARFHERPGASRRRA